MTFDRPSPVHLLATPLLMTSLLTALAPHARAAQEIEDEDVVQAIEWELATARWVPEDDIDVRCDDGVVTLSGEVPHLLGEQRALRIARMVKGVRAVVDRMAVAEHDISDDDIEDSVRSSLLRDPATSSWQIETEVNDGVVTLTGSVDSYAERELAGKVAQGVRGVRELSNRLGVDYEVDRLDMEIAAEVEKRLMWDARVGDFSIDVSVEDGRVALTGFVGSSYERGLARSDAWVAGVSEVDVSGLDVKWWVDDPLTRDTRWANVSEDEIRAAVQDAFLYDPRVASYEPMVSVDGRTVTLTGTVSNLKAKRSAAQDARNTVGVWRVRNLLKVRDHDAPASTTIASNVQDALAADPLLDRHEVRVALVDRTVHLYGTVNSYFERAHAEDLAARVTGVSDVENHLLVGYQAPFHTRAYEDWDPVLNDYDFDYATVRRKPDWEIVEDIESQLWWSPFVDEDEVTVTVEDGVATLTGSVDSWSERSAAEENALEGGAYEVRNLLDIDADPGQ